MDRRPRHRRQPSRRPVDQLASRNSFRYEVQQAVKCPRPGFLQRGKIALRLKLDVKHRPEMPRVS